MKKTICILLALGLLAAVSVPAFAESRGGYGGHGRYYGHGGYYGHSGYGIGGFFAGLVGGAILGTIISSSQATAYYAPPPPAYVPPERVWVPGRYESRVVREWVQGHYENVRIEVWVPGHWEERG